MYLAILGPLEIRRGDVLLPVPGARVRLLLGRLALDANHPVSPTRLADAVWGDVLPADVPNAVQALVSRARRALGGPGAVRMVPGGYQLDITGSDREDFLRRTQAGRSHLAQGRFDQAVTELTAAQALWRGSLLDGAEFAELDAVSLAEQRWTALEDLAQAHLRSGRPDEAVPPLEMLLAAHPLRERSALLLMTALQADGREAEALVVYAALRERLGEQLGTGPGIELQRLHLSVLQGDRAATLATSSTPHQLRREGGGTGSSRRTDHRPSPGDVARDRRCR